MMWNQSLERPGVAATVDGLKNPGSELFWHEWCLLAQWEPDLWKIVWPMAWQEHRSKNQQPPMILWVARQLADAPVKSEH
jgi:hypothetical protein